jgi:hypothetical protein
VGGGDVGGGGDMGGDNGKSSGSNTRSENIE